MKQKDMHSDLALFCLYCVFFPYSLYISKATSFFSKHLTTFDNDTQKKQKWNSNQPKNETTKRQLKTQKTSSSKEECGVLIVTHNKNTSLSYVLIAIELCGCLFCSK